MKVLLLFFFTIFLLSACRHSEPDVHDQINEFFISQMDSMQYHVKNLELAVRENRPAKDLQQNFLKARKAYKRIEALIEFYFPELSKAINGPALDKADEYDNKIMEPTGFQVIEEYLFPEFESITNEELLLHIAALQDSKARFEQLIKHNQLEDKNIFEAIRLEMFRVFSLGISGFDSPVAMQSINETKESLQGMETILLFYSSKTINQTMVKNLRHRFSLCYAYITLHPDFNQFDRAEFIMDYLTPLSEVIYKYQQSIGIENNPFISAINFEETNFFSDHILNIEYFTPSPQKKISQEEIALGKLLFFDPILSGNNKRSCASCHQPSNGFADSKKRSTAFNLTGNVSRNAPSLINSGFQMNQFWDLRVRFLEDQVLDVVSNPNEMHGNPDKYLKLLTQSKAYREFFADAYGNDTYITAKHVRWALAAYVRSLQSFNSRFDRYMRGDKSQLDEDEIAGFNLFMGKAKCGTCHFAPLFNGTIPPQFNDTEAEVLGTPTKFDTIAAQLDPDPGKYNTYHREIFRNAFKTPTVRNAGITAPYMHNGEFSTLQDVLDFYNKGGGTGVGIKLSNQTLPAENLKLSIKERQQIIAFIHSLTDTTGLTSAPKHLPEIDNETMNIRLVGGEY